MRPAEWFGRVRDLALPRSETVAAAAPPEAVIRATPGIAALFEGIEPNRSHSVLDLGAAAGSSLGLYGEYARRVRFADPSALDAEQPGAEGPYDVLLLWDTLGRLSPEDRPRMVERLAALSAPGARIHMIIESPERRGARPLHFTLVDLGHVRYELTDDAPAPPRLLPSEVERVLAPFEVLRAFTLKDGFREYVAGKKSPVDRKLGEFRPVELPEKR